MQYVPLTVHLSALAQLYQQCAALSEKHDRLAKGLDIFNTEVNHFTVAPIFDQERIMQEQNTEGSQIQDFSSQKPNTPLSSCKTPVEIDLVTDEDAQIEQGTKPIQNETKKIKKNKQNVNSQNFLQCPMCQKHCKNIAGLRRHQSRMHVDKPLKNVTKKMQNKKQLGNNVQN
ncbi:unnamed protein product [Paramecium primaurelia]|uniref:C2H2-type domain-containing protein n=1 Tax=Paramecium primaurelia TaxID=5886 RepID=A0A8S1NTZ0_PARPR|nr:unnamed protein product [Paramecium primaurelia]